MHVPVNTPQNTISSSTSRSFRFQPVLEVGLRIKAIISPKVQRIGWGITGFRGLHAATLVFSQQFTSLV